jgi:hypothetical protein
MYNIYSLIPLLNQIMISEKDYDSIHDIFSWVAQRSGTVVYEIENDVLDIDFSFDDVEDSIEYALRYT